MDLKVNWFGLAGGAATLVLLVVSLYVPWWHFSVGDGFLQADISPLNLGFSFVGVESFTVPLIWAVSLSILLYLGAGAVVMIIYSVLPNKPYSKRLLGFAYRKPIYAVVLFLVEIVGLILVVKSMLGVEVPLMGSTVVQLPPSLTQNMANVSFLVSSDLLWPFWFSILVVALCILAKVYHKKIGGLAQPYQPEKTE